METVTRYVLMYRRESDQSWWPHLAYDTHYEAERDWDAITNPPKGKRRLPSNRESSTTTASSALTIYR